MEFTCPEMVAVMSQRLAERDGVARACSRGRRACLALLRARGSATRLPEVPTPAPHGGQTAGPLRSLLVPEKPVGLWSQ